MGRIIITPAFVINCVIYFIAIYCSFVMPRYLIYFNKLLSDHLIKDHSSVDLKNNSFY